MKSLLFATVLFASAILSLHAQVSGNSRYTNTATSFGAGTLSNASANASEIAFEISGLYNVLAADYVATFNIVQVAEDAKTANDMMNIRINQLTQSLKALGIDTSSVKIDLISFVPKYDYAVENRLFSKTYNEIPVGFELQKNISIHYKNSNQLDGIITAATVAEIYDLVKVDYFVPDMEKRYAELREKCMQELKTRLKSYELIGFKLDTMEKSMAENYVAIYPPNRYLRYQAFSRPSLTAARKKTTVNNEEKPSTQYYSAVDAQYYDVVINPLVVEPMVQFSYTLSVKCYIKNEQGPTYIHVLTPAGDLKQVQIK